MDPTPVHNGLLSGDAPSDRSPQGSAPTRISRDSIRLQLDQFEGPFEVLLYLIREQEIDIFDIPIVRITEQYLGVLDLMRQEHLDIAGEFLVMAAALIEIKSRMLIPIEAAADEEEPPEEEDPRLELVEKLLEYRKYRDLAALLGKRWDLHAERFSRKVQPPELNADPDEEGQIEVSLYDLIRVVRRVLRFLGDDLFHRVVMEETSVEEKIDRLSGILVERQSVCWSDLARECRSRLELVCYLLAILELCRMNRIRVHQYGAFGEIRIVARDSVQPVGPVAEPQD